MRKLPFLLASQLAFLLVFSANGLVAAQTSTKLIANTTKSQDDFSTRAFQLFAERVGKYTNGRVNVEVHFGAELGYKTADALRILESHTVDISDTVGAFDSAVFPDIAITTLPFFIASFDEFEFFDRMFREHLNKMFATKNAMCLFSYSNTPQHFWNNKVVSKLSDLAGVKMRTYDKVTSDMLVAMGAAPLRIDFSELYNALQQGTVAGLVTSVTSVLSVRLYEVVTHGNLTAFSMGGLNCLAINLQAWNALGPENQNAMLRAAREAEDWVRVRVPELEREGLKDLEAKGMKINQVPSDVIGEMRKRTEPIRAEFLGSKASPELRAIVDRYEKVRARK